MAFVQPFVVLTRASPGLPSMGLNLVAATLDTPGERGHLAEGSIRLTTSSSDLPWEARSVQRNGDAERTVVPIS